MRLMRVTRLAGEAASMKSFDVGAGCLQAYVLHACTSIGCVCTAVPVVGTRPGRRGCGRLARARRLQCARSWGVAKSVFVQGGRHA